MNGIQYAAYSNMNPRNNFEPTFGSSDSCLVHSRCLSSGHNLKQEFIGNKYGTVRSNQGKMTNNIGRSKMTFILGGSCKISDTRGPIGMKLSGCIELTLRLCNVVFLISGLDQKTGNWNFSENFTIIPCNNFLKISDFPGTETSPN